MDSDVGFLSEGGGVSLLVVGGGEAEQRKNRMQAPQMNRSLMDILHTFLNSLVCCSGGL
jgi:hypothetical protein